MALRRQAPVVAVLLGALACRAPEEADGGVDALIDARVHAGAIFRLEPGEHYGVACEPWGSMLDIPEALPLDSTPRELWRWSPVDDPTLGAAAGIFNPTVGPVARSLDGTIYTVAGNESEWLVAIAPTGALRWARELGTIAGYPVALPDGRVLVDRSPEQVELRAPTGELVEALSPRAAGSVTSVVGPAGRLYLVQGNTVMAVCQDGGLVWSVVFAGRGFSHARVEPDGTLTLEASAAGAPPLRVTPDGDVREVTIPVPVGPLELLYSQRIGATTMYTVASPATGDARYFIELETEAPWPIPMGPSLVSGTGGYLDAVGGVWMWTELTPGSDVAHRLRRFPTPGVVGFDRSDALPSPQAVELAADGSLVGASSGIDRFTSADGSSAWHVTLSRRVGTRGGSALAPDGVLYLGTTDGVFAIQTDALPPVGDRCTPPGCNGRRDGASRLFH